MQILEGGDFRALIEQSANSAGGGVGRGECCNAWNVITNRRATNRFFVVERFAAERRVDDQVDLAGFDEVNDVGPALVYFEDGFCWNPCSFECRGGTAGSEQPEAKLVKLFSERAKVSLVAIVDAEKNRAFARQPLSRSELRFREGQTIGSGNTHHFARRSHLGTQNGVHAAEFVEWKNRRFHGIEFVNGNLGDAAVVHERQIHIGQFLARHQPRGNFRQRNARRFADIGDRARRSRIHFENVNRVALDGILHVHEADNFQREGKSLRIFPDVLKNRRRHTHRGQHARRIAGVHPGFFDVLHDAANDDIFPVGESIDIDFRGFFEKLINQNRPRGAHHRGLCDVLLHRVYVVGDDHGAPAENVAWADKNRHADFGGNARRFFRNQRGAVAGLRYLQFFEQTAKPAPVFGKVNGFGRGPDDRDAIALEFLREIQRRLSAKLDRSEE